MIDGVTVAVVVPARDEVRFVAGVVRGLPSFVDWAVVVDDGSVDGTASVARAAEAAVVVRVVSHREPRGVGGAIVTGYREALELGADVAVVMAGDGQMDPRDLQALLSPLTRGVADYVKGDRLRHPQRRDMPLGRRLGTMALARLTSAVAAVRVRDSQCGYTAISRRALETIDLAAVWPGYGYPNDLLVRLAAAAMRIEEVVVRPVYGGETSGLRVWHAATIVAVIVRAWLDVSSPRALGRRAR